MPGYGGPNEYDDGSGTRTVPGDTGNRHPQVPPGAGGGRPHGQLPQQDVPTEETQTEDTTVPTIPTDTDTGRTETTVEVDRDTDVSEVIVTPDVPTVPSVNPRIEDRYVRDIPWVGLPGSICLPSGYSPFLILSEDFDGDSLNSTPDSWVGGKYVNVKVTDKLAYTAGHSLSIDFQNLAKGSIASRNLLPDLPLKNNRPLVLQMFSHFGNKDDRITIAAYNKSTVDRITEGPLFEIDRTAYEETTIINPTELSFKEVLDLQKYHYLTPATERRLLNGRPAIDNYTTTMNIVDKSKSAGKVKKVEKKKTLGEKRTALYERFEVRYYDTATSGIVTTSYDVTPFSTNNKYKLKLYGWNCITVEFYANTFDLFINGENVVRNATYLINNTDSSDSLRYLGALRLGPAYDFDMRQLSRASSKGLIYLDNIDLYSLRPSNGSTPPDDYVITECVPMPPQTERIPDPGTEIVSGIPIPSGYDYEYTTDGCLIVELNETRLYCDANGCFTYSTDTPTVIKYLAMTEVFVDETGCISANPSICLIKNMMKTKVKIDIDGCLNVGSNIDNRLDVIPFDYAYGEFILMSVLNTNDISRAPAINRVFFEFD